MASVVYNDTPMAPGMSQDLILTVDPSKADGEVLADLTISCEATTTVQEFHAAGAELLVGDHDTYAPSVVFSRFAIATCTTVEAFLGVICSGHSRCGRRKS